jgi:hypothetical protein
MLFDSILPTIELNSNMESVLSNSAAAYNDDDDNNYDNNNILKSLKYCENYQNVTQRHEVSTCC